MIVSGKYQFEEVSTFKCSRSTVNTCDNADKAEEVWENILVGYTVYSSLRIARYLKQEDNL